MDSLDIGHHVIDESDSSKRLAGEYNFVFELLYVYLFLLLVDLFISILVNNINMIILSERS